MKVRLLMLVGIVVLLSGCATTEVLNVWKDDVEAPVKLTKVFVAGVGQEDTYRRIFEQKLVLELQRDGLEAVSLYSVFGDRLKVSEEEANAAIKEHGTDGIIFAQLVDSEKKEVYTPGMTVVTSTGYSSGWYGYYGGGYQAYRTPGRTYNYREATVETVIYSFKRDKPVWRALTRTTEEKKFELIESYIKGIHRPLLESGLF